MKERSANTKKKSPYSSMFDGHTCMDSQNYSSSHKGCRIAAGTNRPNYIHDNTGKRTDASASWKTDAEERAVYYEGIGPEKGKRVSREDAFGYACERCIFGSEEEQAEFLAIAREVENAAEFADVLVEWYYSGNWIERKEEVAYGYVV